MGTKRETVKGLPYSRDVTGKHLFRIRRTYVATHVVRLIKAKAVGAAKVDIALRGVALLPEHAGKRPVGFVLRRIPYQAIYDLCCDPLHFGADLDDPQVIDCKREWVRDQLSTLEQLGLVRRDRAGRAGRRPDIIVLKDDGSGDRFDDPGSVVVKGAFDRDNSYITIHGSVIRDPRFRDWGGPELAAYYCAMTAEQESPKRPPQGESGTGTWFRQIEWFRGKYRRDFEVVYNFGEKTLRKGFGSLADQGWLLRERTMRHDGQRFNRPRTIYTNRFQDSAMGAQVIDLAEYMRSASG
jgi:hypothetical protein